MAYIVIAYIGRTYVVIAYIVVPCAVIACAKPVCTCMHRVRRQRLHACMVSRRVCAKSLRGPRVLHSMQRGTGKCLIRAQRIFQLDVDDCHRVLPILPFARAAVDLPPDRATASDLRRPRPFPGRHSNCKRMHIRLEDV